MIYKTIVTDCLPKAKKMAAEIETKMNEMAAKGWEPITFSITDSCKAIIVFRVPNESMEDDGTVSGDAE